MNFFFPYSRRIYNITHTLWKMNLSNIEKSDIHESDLMDDGSGLMDENGSDLMDETGSDLMDENGSDLMDENGSNARRRRRRRPCDIDDIVYGRTESSKTGLTSVGKSSCNLTKDIDNSPWNYKILLLLKKIGKKTMGYRWMQEQESQYYEKINARFDILEMFILAFLGTVTGGGFINFVVSTDLENNKTVYIIITVIQLVTIFIAAIINGYNNVKDYEKKIIDHKNASIKNAELNLNIQYQLSLNVNDRETDKFYLRNTIKAFNDILVLSPTIRNETKKKYLEESNDNEIFNPIIVEGDGINIVINYDNKNQDENTDKDNVDSQINYQIDRWLQHF